MFLVAGTVKLLFIQTHKSDSADSKRYIRMVDLVDVSLITTSRSKSS